VLVGQQQLWECWLSADCKQYAVKLCSEQQSVCWWGSNISGNFGFQRTANSKQLKLCLESSCVCVGGAATAVEELSVSGL